MTELLPIDTSLRRAKLTADDFALLDRHGAFAAYRKTELIDGEVYFVNAQHRPHGMVKMRLYDALLARLLHLGSRYRPVCEFTLSLSRHDRPEPDVMLTSEPDGDGFVPVATVPLVIEVSDTTLRIDLGRKLRQYARAGVPEYWVANVGNRVIHRFWTPAGAAFKERDLVAFGQPIASATIDGLSIETAGL
ncbi:Uma2 family endonuclease [Sphingomonas sp.]|uniref:Uma2 family endonuclease n=1 Tax=Sphingomonas sp. TaxID=28214 RepID=UPI003CC69ABB